MSQFTIGLDIGTTSTKTVLFGDTDGIAAQASRSVELISVAPGHAEADPEQWLSNVSDCILEVTSAAGVRADQIRAMAATGMVPAVVLVDAAGRPLRRAILQSDARASAEIDEMRETLGSFDLVALTGSAMTLCLGDWACIERMDSKRGAGYGSGARGRGGAGDWRW